MPNKDGSLTQEELDKAEAWFQQHWKGVVPCPINPEHENWTLSDHIVALPIGGSPTIEQYYSHIRVTCNTCGYAALFNSHPMGINVPETIANGGTASGTA